MNNRLLALLLEWVAAYPDTLLATPSCPWCGRPGDPSEKWWPAHPVLTCTARTCAEGSFTWDARVAAAVLVHQHDSGSKGGVRTHGR